MSRGAYRMLIYIVYHGADCARDSYKTPFSSLPGGLLTTWTLFLVSGMRDCEAASARLGLTEPEGFGETRVERTAPMQSIFRQARSQAA